MASMGAWKNLTTPKISSNPNYHTKYSLFPIGYTIERIYPSIKHKGRKDTY